MKNPPADASPPPRGGACPACPCPAICLRWPSFCSAAATGDELARKHICARSAAPAARPSATDALAGLRRLALCPYRSRPECGCAAARCGLRGGATVTHLDCLPCLERYGP